MSAEEQLWGASDLPWVRGADPYAFGDASTGEALHGADAHAGVEPCVIIDTDWDIDDMMAIPSILANRHVAAIVTTRSVSLPSVAADGLHAFLSPFFGETSLADLSIPVIEGLGVSSPLDDKPWLPPLRASQARINDFLSVPYEPSEEPVPALEVRGAVATAVETCDNVELLLIGPFTSYVAYADVLGDRVSRVVMQGRPAEGTPPDVMPSRSFNCGYDADACAEAYPDLLRSNPYWVDVPRGGPEAYQPSLEMVMGLEPEGLPGALREVLLGDQHTWNPTMLRPGASSLLWDETAAQFLLDPSGFQRNGRTWEPAMPLLELQERWTDSINQWPYG